MSHFSNKLRRAANQYETTLQAETLIILADRIDLLEKIMTDASEKLEHCEWMDGDHLDLCVEVRDLLNSHKSGDITDEHKNR